MKKYDYLVVGAGLFGCVFAHEMHQAGKSVLVIEKEDYLGGMCHTEKLGDIFVHMNGAHIFHTDNKEVWDYINQFSKFNNYRHRVIARYNNKNYSLPFNMNTFYEIYGVTSIEAAKECIQKDIVYYENPTNLKEQALSLVGTKLYDILIKDYTEKQWGRRCEDLPPEIIKRLPLHYIYNNDYFNDKYQGIPEEGYTNICKKLLEGIPYKLNTPYKDKYSKLAYKVIYTGPIDELMKFKFGNLSYRGLTFISNIIEKEYYQGTSVINYTDMSVDYTRIIEHKLFTNTVCPYTIITKEYPSDEGLFYPINDKANNMLYNIYRENLDSKFIAAGRLGSYKYYDMDDTIEAALNLSKKEKKEKC